MCLFFLLELDKYEKQNLKNPFRLTGLKEMLVYSPTDPAQNLPTQKCYTKFLFQKNDIKS